MFETTNQNRDLNRKVILSQLKQLYILMDICILMDNSGITSGNLLQFAIENGPKK